MRDIVLFMFIILCVYRLYIPKTTNTNLHNRPKNDKKISFANIKMYGYDSCPYTVKLKEEFDNKGVEYEYRPIDVNSKFNKEYKQYKMDGVPLTVNVENNKKHIGYNSADAILEKLK